MKVFDLLMTKFDDEFHPGDTIRSVDELAERIPFSPNTSLRILKWLLIGLGFSLFVVGIMIIGSALEVG